MSKLREPVPPGDAVVALIAGPSVFAINHWALHATAITIVVAILMVEFVVQPVSTLLHELGHAAAAASLGASIVSVMVGRGPWARFKVGRVQVNFSPLPTRGVLIRGVCRYKGDIVSWRARAWIALAGPAVTLLELLAVVTIGWVAWSTGGPLVRELILLTVLGLVGGVLTNLIPTNRKGSVLPNDGWVARRCLELHRQSAPLAGRQLAFASGSPRLGANGELPAHWAPSDPRQRKGFEEELRAALRPAAAGDDPEERKRLEDQLRVALTPPDEAYRRLGEIERQSDQDRANTSIPPPAPRPKP